MRWENRLPLRELPRKNTAFEAEHSFEQQPGGARVK
jgi:hypothetical protein